MPTPWFGSKRLAAKRHLYGLPWRTVCVEPFAGMAGYSMIHQERFSRIILVDKDPEVVAIWRWILRATPEEVMSYRIPPDGELVTDPFLLNFLDRWKSRRSRDEMFARGRLRELVLPVLARLARELPEIQRKTTVIEGDYTCAPDIEACWFIDPPYRHVGGYAPGCDSASLDYEKLALWCRARRGQVTVTEAIGADWLPFLPLAPGLKEFRSEAVWRNGDHDPFRAAQ